MSKVKALEKIVLVAGEVLSSSTVQKMVLGTYSDGTTRSLPDAIDGEIYSPGEKAKMAKRCIGNGKKKKKKKKHKKKQKTLVI